MLDYFSFDILINMKSLFIKIEFFKKRVFLNKILKCILDISNSTVGLCKHYALPIFKKNEINLFCSS